MFWQNFQIPFVFPDSDFFGGLFSLFSLCSRDLAAQRIEISKGIFIGKVSFFSFKNLKGLCWRPGVQLSEIHSGLQTESGYFRINYEINSDF